MPSRFEQYRPVRGKSGRQPPLVTPVGLGLSACAWLGAAVLPQPYVSIALAISVIWTLKVVAPVFGSWSRRAEGAVADVFYVVGFLLPYAPSLALVLILDIPAAYGPATIAAPFLGFLLFLLFNWQKVCKLYDPGLMKIVPPKKGGSVILEGFGAALSAISQEILYRGLVFFSLQHLGVAFATAVSACLFVAEHLANRWATREFDTLEYLKQIGLSLICCLLCALTGGTVAAVLMHLGYNIVPVARNLVHKMHFERATGDA